MADAYRASIFTLTDAGGSVTCGGWAAWIGGPENGAGCPWSDEGNGQGGNGTAAPVTARWWYYQREIRVRKDKGIVIASIESFISSLNAEVMTSYMTDCCIIYASSMLLANDITTPNTFQFITYFRTNVQCSGHIRQIISHTE